MPAFLLHGWMPDAYRAAPLPVLAVFSGVLAKVGAYGFLRVVLPLFPDATVEFQEVILVIALASILYGSVMAFTQTNVRLIAGYSSVAQLGFITAGIFALRADGADGAVLQMVNHGLVVAPLFVIVAILAERTGTEDIREMGGMAMRAPVLAALFLIVTLATLAMPGSANFIGEFYILNGLFQAKIVFAFVAISGVAMSAYYALRLYQRDDAQPPAPTGSSRVRSAGATASSSPRWCLHRRPRALPAADPRAHRAHVQQTVASVTGGNAPEAAGGEAGAAERSARSAHGRSEAMNFHAPDIDYAGISPLIALTVGLCVVLLSAVFKPLQRRAPGLTLLTLAAAAGLLIWQWGDPKDLVAGALRIDELAIAISLIAIFTAAFASCSRSASRPPRRPAAGEYHALLLGSVLGMIAAGRRRRTWSPSSSPSRRSRSPSTSSAPPTCAARTRSSRGSST